MFSKCWIQGTVAADMPSLLCYHCAYLAAFRGIRADHPKALIPRGLGGDAENAWFA